jgi:UDP-N-acetylmuramate--alanine ligase
MKVSIKKFQNIRFLGAEGIGMSALIRIIEKQIKNGIVDKNTKISKSDLSYELNDPLDHDIDLVVRSTAISSTDSEYLELKNRGIEIWHRSDMLNYLSQNHKEIVISGTHGKTTCSALLSHILIEANLDPCFAVGGILKNYSTNGDYGSGEYFILEGDESDKSFTKTNPYLALVTNIEPDHLENYPGGIDEIQECFFEFLDKAQLKIICIDNPILAKYYRELSKACKDLIYTYSESELKEYDLDYILKGKHNQLNALACIKTAEALGVDPEQAIKSLKSFQGIKRRFELINNNYRNKVTVYDDYAHHPTEVKALLEAALSLKPKKLLFVYQPHHPERTQQFWNEFVEVFKEFPQEHLCLIADIYVARSRHIEGVNSGKLVGDINNPSVRYIAPLATETTLQGNIKDMTKALKPVIDDNLDNCDYLFIVGAGDISKIVPAFHA